MKTLMIALLCTLTASLGYAEKNPIPVLELEGFFLSKNSVKYTLYEVINDTTYEEVTTKRGFRGYNVDLEIGKCYAIVFRKGDHVKFLYIEAEVPGLKELDVDFHNDKAGNLVYNQDKDDYIVHPYDPKNNKQKCVHKYLLCP